MSIPADLRMKKMDVATGRTWTSYEWSCGAWQAKEHIFKRVLADLRGRQTCSQGCHNLQANAQPKAVFFCAMTVLDKICGWGEEENLGGISICSLYVDVHQTCVV